MGTDYFSSLGEVANIREYGRGILVQTIYCMPQTTEPLIVGILEKPDNKFELTDFSFATEFVQNSRYDYSGIPEKICEIAKKYNVPIFRKTSCLFSYVHNLPRDYNAHYYRPTELGCNNCIMNEKCQTFKSNLTLNKDLKNIIPFEYEIINKQNHICILKQKGICEYPTEDCSHISGNIIRISKKITTSDVRVIKWLTGYTVDADFYESNKISDEWFKNKTLTLRRKDENSFRH